MKVLHRLFNIFFCTFLLSSANAMDEYNFPFDFFGSGQKMVADGADPCYQEAAMYSHVPEPAQALPTVDEHELDHLALGLPPALLVSLFGDATTRAQSAGNSAANSPMVSPRVIKGLSPFAAESTAAAVPHEKENLLVQSASGEGRCVRKKSDELFSSEMLCEEESIDVAPARQERASESDGKERSEGNGSARVIELVQLQVASTKARPPAEEIVEGRAPACALYPLTDLTDVEWAAVKELFEPKVANNGRTYQNRRVYHPRAVLNSVLFRIGCGLPLKLMRKQSVYAALPGIQYQATNLMGDGLKYYFDNKEWLGRLRSACDRLQELEGTDGCHAGRDWPSKSSVYQRIREALPVGPVQACAVESVVGSVASEAEPTDQASRAAAPIKNRTVAVPKKQAVACALPRVMHAEPARVLLAHNDERVCQQSDLSDAEREAIADLVSQAEGAGGISIFKILNSILFRKELGVGLEVDVTGYEPSDCVERMLGREGIFDPTPDKSMSRWLRKIFSRLALGCGGKSRMWSRTNALLCEIYAGTAELEELDTEPLALVVPPPVVRPASAVEVLRVDRAESAAGASGSTDELQAEADEAEGEREGACTEEGAEKRHVEMNRATKRQLRQHEREQALAERDVDIYSATDVTGAEWAAICERVELRLAANTTRIAPLRKVLNSILFRIDRDLPIRFEERKKSHPNLEGVIYNAQNIVNVNSLVHYFKDEWLEWLRAACDVLKSLEGSEGCHAGRQWQLKNSTLSRIYRG